MTCTCNTLTYTKLHLPALKRFCWNQKELGGRVRHETVPRRRACSRRETIHAIGAQLVQLYYLCRMYTC